MSRDNSESPRGLNREIHLPKLPSLFAGEYPTWLPMALFWAIFALGAGIRLWQFPNVPAGLNQDELSAGYESWSLFLHGSDRWGYHLPVYFLSWGSGMNVLYSYLSIPFIAMFGLTPLAVRMVGLLLGLALLPLLYVTVRHLRGRAVALVAMALAACVPWAFMAARWGLEANILPFFLLLGTYTLTRALRPDARTWQRVIALIPFAIALYAYAVAIVPVLVILAGLALLRFRVLRRNLVTWAGAYALWFLVALPFLLFLLKNNLLHHALGIEHWLPFSIPLLPDSRLAQVNTLGPPFWENIQAVLNGFQDYHVENSLVQHAPLPTIVRLLVLVEIIYVIYALVRRRQRVRDTGVIGLWLIGCLPFFWLFPLYAQRANAFMIPLIVLAASGFVHLCRLGIKPVYRGLIAIVCALMLLVPTVGALQEYFGESYAAAAAANFRPGLTQPFSDATRLAGDKQLYVSQSFNLNYMLTLWYTHTDPVTFRAAHPTVKAYDFGRFYFFRQDLVGRAGYYFLIPREENIARQCAQYQILRSYPNYLVGYCSAAVR